MLELPDKIFHLFYVGILSGIPINLNSSPLNLAYPFGITKEFTNVSINCIIVRASDICIGTEYMTLFDTRSEI